MLVYSTKIPLREETTRPQCVQLFIDWVVYSKRYPFEAKDFEGYDVNGHENLDISKEGYTFSITFFKDDNLTLAACKLVTANESEVWTTLNVAVCEKDTKFLSVQTHCTKRIFSAFLPKAKSPFTVKLFLRNNMCALDGGLPVIDRPILMTPELIPICGKIMQGNGQITMPVVYISHDYWPLDIDTAGLAKELQGLAHVLVEQDTATSMALKEASNGRNVYRGYIGLYFPGASYCRKFNLTEISGEQACNEIIDIVKSTLLNKADAARYTWEEIKAMQGRQKVGKLQIDKAKLGELREWYETFMDENERLERELASEKESKAKLFDENQRLHGILDGYKKTDRKDQPAIIKAGKEKDLYPGEQADLIIEILRQRLKSLDKASRPYQIIEAILKANKENGNGDKIQETIKRVFSDGGDINSGAAKRELQAIGFTVSKDGKHYKLVFADNPRYTFIVSATPSDYRSGDNEISKIFRTLFLVN